MKFDTTMVMMIFAFLIILLGMYQARKMKTMVHCTYTSQSNQTYDKLVREKDGYVVFDGRAFPLLPQYSTSRQWDKGLSSFFPTKIAAYTFKWNSDLPVDPSTGEPAILTPENMNKLRNSGMLGSYISGNQQALTQGKGKQGFMEKMMPIILIVIALVSIYCVYQTYMMGKDQKIMKEAISDIYYKTGIVD